MENKILEQFAAASMAAEAAVNATEVANTKANQALAEMFNLRRLADEATANVDYAYNTCTAYLQQMSAMSKRMQALREAYAIKEMKEILPEANKLNDDFQKAKTILIQAYQRAENATAAYNQARIFANNLVAEAARLANEAQKAIDYANQLSQQTSDAL